MKSRKLFCQRNKLFYMISLVKEYLIRDMETMFSGNLFAKKTNSEKLPNIIKGHRSVLIRNLYGVDPQLQYNKVKNLELASKKINGIIINPGEIFSFWKLVGRATRKRGYLEGLTLSTDNFSRGVGGGLCQLANMIHWLVLNSPLEVIEIHHHSDALFPDDRRHVPFGTGTSVFYKNIDYQFKNTSQQRIQLLLWLDEIDLCGELRSESPFPYRYKLVEENQNFIKEGSFFYRISQVYKIVIERETNTQVAKELILNNHSKVMYDYALIPTEQIIEV